MSDKKPVLEPIDKALVQSHMEENSQNAAQGMLGDEQRVKVLSPGMMVFRRFIRNRLAITGLIILIIMFVFSFLGGLVTPYRQDETFYSTESMLKEYAGATRNSELRYTVAQGETFSKGAYAQMILAINKGQDTFSSGGKNYILNTAGTDLYIIQEIQSLVKVITLKNLFSYKPAEGFTPGADFKAAFETAFKAKEGIFTADGTAYHIMLGKNEASVGPAKQVAVASMRNFDAAEESDLALVNSFPFRLASEQAIAAGQTQFTLDAVTYEMADQEGSYLISQEGPSGPRRLAVVSEYIVNAISPDIFLTLDFKAAAVDSITSGSPTFTYDDILYTNALVHQTYNIKSQVDAHVFDMYHMPDARHPLGTDQNGMDVLTRLMFGGRISLMVGFVVVILEILIGIVIGGISGYFGGWVDTMLMRFIDLFNCIPFWPILIITGSVMDTMELDPYVRIFLMMFILGLMGWTGIARVVRGQILALREQDFMIATEATGIRVSRRIGKHLVPNVMPLLIVQATMGLGGIILTEATLSFLGLGIKHPLASWGSIINAASNPYVMTNYWFIWLPAGLLILLTVLGFNFVGDGLRDAFDPKMKR